MSDKAAKKKQFILDTARGVFAKKGFKDVTMKDIVDACGISRGGLYLYYDNTESIFTDCIKETAGNVDYFTGHTAGDGLALFLNEQKKAIFAKENDLSVATYEYMFLKKAEGDGTLVRSLYEENFKTLTKLLEKGIESEEFYCEDVTVAAKNIIYTIEGLKLTAQIMDVSEDDVDMELLYILSGLILEE